MLTAKNTFIYLIAGLSVATGADFKKAQDLYQRTEYRASLAALEGGPGSDAATLALMGKDFYMLGEYKRASDAFHKAVELEPNSSELTHWLGRAYGRRAETANPLAAPNLAGKTRQYFERAVELDPKNREALNDLFDYYLQAPGFLGGGFDKAAVVAKKIGEIDPAEQAFAESQLALKKKQFDTAEEQLRRAIALAPRQVGRVVDLARYLGKQGRYQESDAAFQQAEKLAPNSPKVMFERAHSYVQQKRNLDVAKTLLEKYLQSPVGPEDPSKAEAQKLLKQVATGA